MRVERFSLFMGPLLVKFRRGRDRVRHRADPARRLREDHRDEPARGDPARGGATRAYYNQAVWKRIVVILAGPAMNLLIAFVIVWALVAVGRAAGDQARSAGTHQERRGDRGGRPRRSVLKPGDQVVSVDGVSGSPRAIRRQLGTHRCARRPRWTAVGPPRRPRSSSSATARLQTLRGAAPLRRADKRPLLGFSFGAVTEPVGAVDAASITGSNLWSVTTQTVSTVARLFEPQERKQLHSIVYGYTATQESFATSTTQALWVLALISLSLAIINLFPFLPLDGGHVFWAVAEKVRGQAHPVRGDGTRRGRRVRADPVDLRHRPDQRHLDPVWAGHQASGSGRQPPGPAVCAASAAQCAPGHGRSGESAQRVSPRARRRPAPS